mmetsp:Transcript_57333/g.102471  ORF Transcript_57333/g.102471 Transcript_57333/m.102471 type:complete len:388 (-) Transcript_57333:634-1797(-)
MLVLLQVGGVVEDHVRRSHLELNDLVIHSNGARHSAHGFLHVHVKAPELDTLPQPLADRFVGVVLPIWSPCEVDYRGALKHLVGRCVVVLPYFKLRVLCPDRCQVVNRLVFHLHRLFEDETGQPDWVCLRVLSHDLLCQAFIVPCKAHPQHVGLANCTAGVHSGNGLSIRGHHLLRALVKKLYTVDPLMDVMGVLPEEDRVEQLRAPFKQMVQPRGTHVDVLILGQRNTTHLHEGSEGRFFVLIHWPLVCLFILLLVLAYLVDFGCQQVLLEVGVGIVDLCEILHGGDGGDPLLIYISGHLEASQPNVKICQRAPELSNFRRELFDPGPNDSLCPQVVVQHVVLGLLGQEGAQLDPELVLGLTLGGDEVGVVEHLDQLVDDLEPLPL